MKARERAALRRATALTDEEFDDIIDTAGYGIGYWCDHAYVGDHAYKVGHSEQPVDGHTETVLRKGNIADAIARILDGRVQVSPRIVAYIRPDEEGESDIDSDAADVIVQVAIFGEVVFG